MKERAHMRSNRAGFSLIEAAVVVALIGLVAGVILVSQSMMQRVELRSVLTDAVKYATAIQQFKMKYGSLPGDMPTAVNIWGAAAGCPNAASVGNATCNGNGNGTINGSAVNEVQLCEHYRVWQQLVASGLIDGAYTGNSGLANCAPNSVPIVNSPESKLASSSFSVTSYGDLINNGSAAFFDGNYDNVLLFGATRANDFAVNPALTATEAAEMDQKSDDGNPTIGFIRGARSTSGVNPNCVKASGVYNEIFRDPACGLMFMYGFATRP